MAKLRHRLVFSICVQTYNVPLTEGWCDENNFIDDPTVWLDLYQRGWRGRKNAHSSAAKDDGLQSASVSQNAER
ncbi:hypothetical protein ACOCHN_06210 [Klebsiella pneumoniae]|nr:hypothetical protein [Klebsiella pneumoniae subsp. pneumoniae]